MEAAAKLASLAAFGLLAALLGDWLGHRLGRSRLSLFSMRPRTTGRVVAMVVGMFIPLTTVAVAAYFSQTARDLLTNIGGLRRQIESLTDEQQRLLAQTFRLESRRSAAQQAASQAREQLGEKRQQLAQAKARLARSREQFAKAQRDLADVRRRAEAQQRNLEDAQRNLEQAQRNLDEAQRNLDEAQKATKEAETALQQTEGERDEAEAGRDVAQEAAVSAQKQRGDAEQLAAEAETRTSEAETRAVQTQERLRHLERQYELRTAEVQAPVAETGQVLSGVVVDATDRESALDGVLRAYLAADGFAQQLGAARGPDGRHIRLVWPEPPGRPRPEEGFSRDEIVLTVVGELLVLGGEAVVVASLWALPNDLIFRAGETIVALRFPAGTPEDQAFGRLWRVISSRRGSEVRRQARERGMLPDPQTDEYGQVAVADLLSAARQIAAADTMSRVAIRAAADTYTIGPLPIEIAVEKETD